MISGSVSVTKFLWYSPKETKLELTEQPRQKIICVWNRKEINTWTVLISLISLICSLSLFFLPILSLHIYRIQNSKWYMIIYHEGAKYWDFIEIIGRDCLSLFCSFVTCRRLPWYFESFVVFYYLFILAPLYRQLKIPRDVLSAEKHS